MSMELNKANECTCPSGDGSLRWPCPAHPAEQAGGDERKLSDLGNELHNLSCAITHTNEEWAEQISSIARELWKWPDRAALAQPSPKCVKCGGTGEADSGGVHPWGEPVLIPCDCETEQEEAERPEVVARVDGTDEDWFIQPEDETELHNEGLLFAGCELGRMIDFDRIVGELRAENAKLSEALDRWPLIRDSLKLRLADALARVAELEGKLTDWVHEGFRLNEALAVAKAQHSVPDDDMILQIFADNAEHSEQGDEHGYCIVREQHAQAIARKLLAAAPTQAQHSGPETTNKEANSFLRVADAGQFKDNAAAVRTAAMIIRGLLHGPAIMKSIIRHRIGLTPEYEGQWHADLYGEAGEVQHHAEADTPDEAVRAVVALAAAPGKEGA
ncbi:TPA: hypothetical protein NID03_006048 [Pseudomonas aeruginosa]|nr:hypothetical protein [Pseudomonas aeruginosa]